MENITHELYLKNVTADIKVTPPSIDYPNVVTIESTITANRTCKGVDEFMMIDLAFKSFSPLSESEARQGYWQSLASYEKSVREAAVSVGYDFQTLFPLLMEFVVGNSDSSPKLTTYHDICNTFSDDYIHTDSLFALNTKPEDNENEWRLEVFKLNPGDASVLLWNSLTVPKMKKTESLPAGSLRQYYECRLAHGRFLLVYPTGVSNIGDCVLGPNSHIYILQKIPMLVNYNRSYAYGLVEINVSESLGKVVKLTVSEATKSASMTHRRFRLFCCGDFILTWYFNSAGAFGDVFSVHCWNDEKKKMDAQTRNLENKLFRIQNSRSFSAYNFDGKRQLQDFVRDLTAIVTLGSRAAFFAGASLISAFTAENVRNITIDSGSRQVTALKDAPGIMAFQAHLPVFHIMCEQKTNEPLAKMNFIGDFAAFCGDRIFVRWVDMVGRDRWGVWEHSRNEWRQAMVREFNAEKWNQILGPCFAWNERWKTVVTIVEASADFEGL